MKRFLHILLAAVFIYNLMGYAVVFHVLQYCIKREVKEAIKTKIPESDLTIIAVTGQNINELHWFEDGREFLYHGEMYDVVRTEQKGDITLYYCINDADEKKLFAGLDNHIDQHLKNDLSTNKKTKSLLQKVIKDYFFTAMLSCDGSFPTMISYPAFMQSLHSADADVPAPPPKFIS